MPPEKLSLIPPLEALLYKVPDTKRGAGTVVAPVMAVVPSKFLTASLAVKVSGAGVMETPPI